VSGSKGGTAKIDDRVSYQGAEPYFASINELHKSHGRP